MSSEPEKQAAAKIYDEAVRLFDSGSYVRAAQAFLRADELLPSAPALESAIASARRANDHMLVATAARRGIEREREAPKLGAEARIALAEAERHLVRLDLTCAPMPCTLSIDGKPATTGVQHLLPGTHTLRANAGSAGREQRLQLDAGSAYAIQLTLEPERAPAASPSPPPVDAAPARSGESGPPADKAARKPLEPWTFYVGAGVTAGLAVATAWSGADALEAANSYRNSSTRTREDQSNAYAAMRRTDYLLVGSLVAAGVTTYAGLFLVEWNAGKSALRAGPMLGSAGVVISGEVE